MLRTIKIQPSGFWMQLERTESGSFDLRISDGDGYLYEAKGVDLYRSLIEHPLLTDELRERLQRALVSFPEGQFIFDVTSESLRWIYLSGDIRIELWAFQFKEWMEPLHAAGER